MRPVEYRVWDTKERRMTIPKVVSIDENGSLSFGGFYKEEFIPMQFIGRYDKDGRKIYEGDILENMLSRLRAEVKWADYYCGFVADVKRGGGYTCPILGDEGIVVIGNIYETPELLREGSDD